MEDAAGVAELKEAVDVAWLKAKRQFPAFATPEDERRAKLFFGLGFTAGTRWAVTEQGQAFLFEEA